MSTLYNGFLEVLLPTKILAVSIIHHYPIFSAVSSVLWIWSGIPLEIILWWVHPCPPYKMVSLRFCCPQNSSCIHYPSLSHFDCAVSSVLWMGSGIPLEIILWWVHPCPPYKMVSLRCCCPQNSSCIHYPIFSAVSSVLWMWSGIPVEIILWWVHPCPPYTMVSLRWLLPTKY